MRDYLILKLQGPMQAWGTHTYEDYRPTQIFPTRSGVLGLLAACLGIDRSDLVSLQALSHGLRYAVRADRIDSDNGERIHPLRLTDYHTIIAARKVDGKANPNPVQSRREYLCDASFTVAIEASADTKYPLEDLQVAVERPRYTPSLGRRSCPLGRPLFHSILEAESPSDALGLVEPFAGTVYTEEPIDTPNRLTVRDVPIYGHRRQFTTREVRFFEQEVNHVPQ